MGTWPVAGAGVKAVHVSAEVPGVCSLRGVNDSIAWLTVPEFAEALGVRASDIREQLRLRTIVAVRRGDNQAWSMPADFIIDDGSGPRVLPTLHGTFTLLADGGFTDEESVEWLTSESEELGSTPLQALRDGKRAPVRRAAQTLF